MARVKKFIKKAIKRPGALRKALGAKNGIPAGKLAATISRLRKKAEGEKKLSASELRLLKQALLARTLKKLPRRK